MVFACNDICMFVLLGFGSELMCWWCIVLSWFAVGALFCAGVLQLVYWSALMRTVVGTIWAPTEKSSKQSD